MSPDAERGPLDRAPVQTLSLFSEDTTDQQNPPSIPLCIWCAKPALRRGADGRPAHSSCEPLDAGLTHPLTSLRAAKGARKGSGSLLAQAILAELHRRPSGATDDELRSVFPEAPPGSVSKRRCDLVRDGLARDSGRTRPTRFGRDAICWVAT